MSTEVNLDKLYENSIKILSDLIGFKTISGEDNNDLIDYCEKYLNDLGATSFKTYDDDKKRVNLFATIKAKKSNGVKPIILSGHTDTVPVSKSWSTDPFKATIKEDKLYGRGSCDMKGFIACTLAFAPVFSKVDLNRDIHFSFTFDEETACLGAPILIKELKKRNIQDGICIVGEPTKMKIIDAHKGCYEYTTYFEGLAGHSSMPHKGVSAVEFASKYANKVLLPQMKKVFPNSKITKEIIGEVTGFDRIDNSEACELVSSLTGDNSREVVSFGTEAGLFQEIGISTVVCGPGSIEQAHKIDEFIELSEIKKCLSFLEGVKNKSIIN